MSIEQLSRIGLVVFLDPDIILKLGSPCDIQGHHPFLILAARKVRGRDESLVVPLTSKGSRRTSIPIPPEYRRGTRKFRQTDCYVYSNQYDHWIPTLVLLDARPRGPWAPHDGNAVDPEFVARILPQMSTVRCAAFAAMWPWTARPSEGTADLPQDGAP